LFIALICIHFVAYLGKAWPFVCSSFFGKEINILKNNESLVCRNKLTGQIILKKKSKYNI
jgi:hypothetical protein